MEAQLEQLLTDSDDELPAGWEMRVSTTGKVYYIDHSSRHTQWDHPKTGKELYLSDNLPFGWEKGVDEKGSTIFIDRVNKKSTCIDPRIAYAMTSKKKGRLKFDADSTAMVVLRGRDLSGKTCLITGANSGIGFETAVALALHGCHVILACRDVNKGNIAAEKIKNMQAYHVAVDVLECDLESLESVRKCAEKYISMKWNIDILILNAGVLGIPYGLSVDGIERTFATNYLGHFYLTNLLKDVLISSSYSRVVVVSSESHRFPSLYDNVFNVSNLPIKKCDYWPIVAYNQSKLCNLLFAFELNRRLSKYGVFCNAVHPGNLIYSGLTKHSYIYQALYLMCRPFSKSTTQGASTTIYCATSPELEAVGGYYFNNCCGCNPSSYASDEELARKLWELSENLAYKRVDREGRIIGLG